MTNKEFWKVAVPLLSNKQGTCGNTIILKENEHLIYEQNKLAEIFNEHYIHIVENTTGTAPMSVSKPGFEPKPFDRNNVIEILKLYENHPSIGKIKENTDINDNFSLPLATREKINSIIKKTRYHKSDWSRYHSIETGKNICRCSRRRGHKHKK